MPRTGQPAVRHVASVQRALAVLDALGEAEDDLGTNEISRRTGINASTVSRLLATLTQASFVEHLEETGRYRLGIRLLELGNAVVARLDVREIARPHLVSLADLSGETATLSAPAHHSAVTVDFVQSPSSVQSVARLGRRSVGHATATGKVVLAYGEARVGAPLERYTEHTILDSDELVAELASVRERGYATAIRERESDLNGVAAPVWSASGELSATIGVQGPSSRFDARAINAVVPELIASGSAISRALGWRPE